MGKKNKYYLIARNTIDNSFNVIDFEGELERIDLYTTTFPSEEELIEDLYSDAKISSRSVDLYIASPRRNDNKLSIITNEVLYSDSKQIRQIASTSLDNGLEINSFESAELIDKFCWKVKNDSLFYDMVVYKDTDLYPKFTDYFIGKRFQSYYSIRYKDGGWISTSYPLLRNICESFSRYYKEEDNRKKKDLRKAIEEKLLMKIDDKVSYNQLNLYDVPEFSKYNLSKQDKILEVISAFESVKQDDFEFKEDEVVFKEQEKYGNDLEKLKTLLGSELTTLVGLYAKYRELYLNSSDSEEAYENKKVMNEKHHNICRLLYSDTILSNAYEWILLYIKNNTMYGDEYGYQKRKGNRRS